VIYGILCKTVHTIYILLTCRQLASAIVYIHNTYKMSVISELDMLLLMYVQKIEAASWMMSTSFTFSYNSNELV
jgi:hypothetical protein